MCECEIATTSADPPRPAKTIQPPVDVQITWLLQQLSKENICSFAVDRSAETCRTPRRNDEIASALACFEEFREWGQRVQHYFTQVHAVEAQRPTALFTSAAPQAHEDLTNINTDGLYVPVFPVFEEPDKTIATGEFIPEFVPHAAMVSIAEPADRFEVSPLLRAGDVSLLLEEQCRSLAAKQENLTELFARGEPAGERKGKGKGTGKEGAALISAVEAWLSVLAMHMSSLAEHYIESIEYIEHMLQSQLVAAIGKQVGPDDFAQFAAFHDTKLFRLEVQPSPFCYAIRRPEHFPDGILSIENSDGEPIRTITRKLASQEPMSFPINAATSVEFLGDRYLHAWIVHSFAGESSAEEMKLVARARQFSSFLLLIGKITGPDSFAPEDAIILQNKDELLLPLLLRQLPSP